jgi:hypothetical protein
MFTIDAESLHLYLATVPMPPIPAAPHCKTLTNLMPCWTRTSAGAPSKWYTLFFTEGFELETAEEVVKCMVEIL